MMYHGPRFFYQNSEWRCLLYLVNILIHKIQHEDITKMPIEQSCSCYDFGCLHFEHMYLLEEEIETNYCTWTKIWFHYSCWWILVLYTLLWFLRIYTFPASFDACKYIQRILKNLTDICWIQAPVFHMYQEMIQLLLILPLMGVNCLNSWRF